MSTPGKAATLLGAWSALLLGVSPLCAAPQFYAASDYARVPKIDAHMHLHGPATKLMALVRSEGFRVLTINADDPDFPPLEVQQHDAIALRQRFPQRVAFAGTFDTAGFGDPDWSQRTLARIDAAMAQGAVGIKVWKNIGMALRDGDGRYVTLDDARFEPILAHLEQRGIVLLLHQAEPLNCWLPPEQMTVTSDREYYAEHPQYYMYRHPEMPSHEALLAARDAALSRHPVLRVDAVHLASLEWDVDRVAAFLDRFPEANVDLAARMVHLEFQASRDPGRVRAFLIRYQDRVLYGSDDAYGPRDDDPQAVREIRAGWRQDWRFLATAESLHTTEFPASLVGLHLPRAVLDRIYTRNAERMFPGAWPAAGKARNLRGRSTD